MGTRALVIAGAAVLVAAIGGSLLVITNSAPVETGPESGTLVGFYGDSYTLGTGASDYEKRWSTIVSKERGWREFNPSVNGLGFVNNRSVYGPGDLPDQIIQRKPDIAFVTMGLNDNFSYERASRDIHAQIDIDLDRLRAGLPDARIIVVEPFWYADDRPESLGVISGWVAEAAGEIGADYIAGASHWIEGHPEWIAADGLHPNDEGYAEIATRMDAELVALGL